MWKTSKAEMRSNGSAHREFQAFLHLFDKLMGRRKQKSRKGSGRRSAARAKAL